MTQSKTTYSRTIAWIPALLAGALLCAPAIWANPSSLSASDAARVSTSPRDRVVAVPADDVPVIEVDRDGDQLRDEIRPRPIDTDRADTALVFTNRSNRAVEIRCISREHNGSIVGQAGTAVPPHGLRYIRASDFSGGRDYLGSAQCKSDRRVSSSAILFGEEITQLDSESRRRGRGMYHFFPVIATY